jgi:succinate dehydrogenase/fumarate reductase cytochrome b subunit
LDDSFPRRTPNRRITETKLHSKISDDLSVTEEDQIKFSANYFIHDYSSDTEQGSINSCDARIRVFESEEYPRLEFQHKNMSEKDIKYYEGIDDEGIIGMQNALIIDFYEENPEHHRLKNRLNFRNLVIENDFLLRIFPLAKEEKPGIDLYNYGVVFQFLIIIYILFFFSQMTGEKEELSETFKFKRFRTEMIFFMFLQIMLVLLDRYFYISNTFDPIKAEAVEGDATTKSVINNVMQEQNKYNFVKLMVYVTLVILVHVVVIWYFPITGNYKINEQIF